MSEPSLITELTDWAEYWSDPSEMERFVARVKCLVAQARAEALDEAARMCDQIPGPAFPSECAAAIRALKDKRNE